MPRELTQLEQEVASHPSVAWWRGKMREDQSNRGEGRFALQGHTRDFFFDAAQYQAPSRAGKDWDVLAAHIRSLIVLMAKIVRDDCPMRENELDCAHRHPYGVKECNRQHTLAAELYFALAIPRTMFSWERDEWRRSVAARREAKGPLNIFVFPSFGTERVCESDGAIIHEARERYFRRVKPEMFASSAAVREHFVPCDTREKGMWFEEPMVIADPPSISDLMAEIPRDVQHRRPPIHFRLPRNDRTSYTHPNQEHDFPLNCAYVGLFDPSRTDLTARRRAVSDLRKAMRGCRVWTLQCTGFSRCYRHQRKREAVSSLPVEGIRFRGFPLTDERPRPKTRVFCLNQK